MFACWRKTDADTPEVFLDAAVAILSDYPDEIIIKVTDPRTGLPSKLKWPAQPSEVREACEDLMQPIRAAKRWNDIAAEQEAERQRFEGARARAPTQAEIEAKLGRSIGRPPSGLLAPLSDDRRAALNEALARRRAFNAQQEGAEGGA